MAQSESTEAFAVVQMDDSEIDWRDLARKLAKILEVEVADLVHLMPQRSGIFAEKLAKSVAQHCVALAASEGISARFVPQSAVQELPTMIALRSCRLQDDGFACHAAGQEGFIKWPDVLWIDFVSIPAQRKEKPAAEPQAVLNRRTTAEGTPLPEFPSARSSATDRVVSVDLLSYEPWLLIRIPLENFDYATTGLPILPARRQNLVALASELSSRAAGARRGPGLDFLESGGPPKEHRLPNETCYWGYLRWQLTRLFLETAE
jgi:hypothetical protein